MSPFESVITVRRKLHATNEADAHSELHDLADTLAKAAAVGSEFEPQVERCEVECTAAWGDVL